jgi:ketosteroid isomerase-like protein
MSQENVELIRIFNEHFIATGEPAWEALHEDVEAHDHDIMDAGEYRGHEGVARWLEDWSAAWSQFTLDTREYIDAGDSVVIVFLMKATGRGSGLEIEREDAMVCRMRDGLVARIDYFNSRQQALELVGLSA